MNVETTIEDQQLVAAKQRLLELKKKQLAWAKAHRCYFYVPMPEQARYHASKAHTRLVIGTNRSGKTTAGALDDIAFALGFYPWLLPEELKSEPIKHLIEYRHQLPELCLTPFKPPVRILIIVSDWDTADSIWTEGTDESAGKLALYVPHGAIDGRPEKNNMGNICGYPIINGSLIRLDTEASFINDPQSFEGKVWHKVHYDEPPNRRLRVACARGLVDTHGYEDFTMTPLTEPWIKSELADKSETDKSIETFFLHAKDNPHISKEGWQDFISKLHDDEYAARAEGEWLYVRGLVYKDFKAKKYPDGHIIDPLTDEWVWKNGTVYSAIDPHARTPHAWMGLVADKEGRLIVWKEIFKHCLINELCDLIKVRLSFTNLKKDGLKEQLMHPVMRWLCDPIAFIEDPVEKKRWADEFFSNDIPVEEASKRRDQGILDVTAALRDKRLLVCSDCPETIREFQSYVWDEFVDPDRNKKEKPKDKDDHMMENLYRLLIAFPVYVDLHHPQKPIKAYEYVTDI